MRIPPIGWTPEADKFAAMVLWGSMAGSKWFPLGMASAALFAASLFGQNAVPASAPPQQRPIPSLRDATADSPFSLEGNPGSTVEIIPESEMSSADKDLLARSEPAIRKEAQLLAVEDSQPGWLYSEVACHAFPNHLFVRFERNTGGRDVSAFSASISRFGNGDVRVIPILRGGYESFTPATRSARTIATFNQIRAEEGDRSKPYWLDLGMCYAALVGTGSQHTGEARLVLQPNPSLRLSSRNTEMHFVTGRRQAQEWKLVFDHRANLIEATTNPIPQR